jgi:hypothetical protein
MSVTVKHFGFHFPPYGTIGILENLHFNKSLTFYIFDPLTGSELPYNEIATLDKETLFVIIQTGEGHGHRNFDILLNQLIDRCGVIPQHITIYSSCLYDPDSPVNNIGTITAQSTTTLELSGRDYISIEPAYHYVCLNRYPRWERYAVVEALLDNGLDQFGKISYATMFADKKEFSNSFIGKPDRRSLMTSDRYHDRFPMYLDDVVSFEQGYNISTDIASALFNIVTESAYEESDKPVANATSTPSLSEKTYKCFLSAQIPIMVAPQYTVRAARNLGFDMFDDIVQHDAYDTEPAPRRRIKLVVEQVQRICSMSLEELQNLKTQFQSRFQRNHARMIDHDRNVRMDTDNWRNYFGQLGLLV